MFYRIAMVLFGLFLFSVSGWAGCVAQSVGGNDYSVCRFDPAKDHIGLYNLDETGVPLGSLGAMEDMLRKQGKTLSFGMNAGMFGTDFKPIGLYIESGQALHKLSRRNGSGNFHLKPNGVFYISGQSAGVLDSDSYLKQNIVADYATQSGPMLVINGAIHPKFSPTGTSRKIRNGVGVQDDGKVLFVISESAVSFYEFAALFRDEFGCKNALFLDGSVSSLFSTELHRSDFYAPLGPMVGVTEMK